MMARIKSRLWIVGLGIVVALGTRAVIASDPCQLDKLTPDGSVGCFGTGVAIDDPWAAVGDSCDNLAGSSAGSVTMFRREELKWIRQSPKLVGSGIGFKSRFGLAVDIEGDVMVVGAPYIDLLDSRKGKAFVFRRQGFNWVEEQILLPAAPADWDWFGAAVAISGDVIAIGAPSFDDKVTPTTYVFRWNGAAWNEEAALTAPGPGGFGSLIALEGNRLVAGRYRDGQRRTHRVYAFNGSVWVLAQELFTTDPEGSDTMASSLAMSGDFIVAGASGSDEFGTNSGSAYVFRREGGLWVQDAKLLASDADFQDEFGHSVRIDGTDILVASRGKVYPFQHRAGLWVETERLPRPAEVGSFATAMDLELPYAIVVGDNAAYTYFVPVCIPTLSEYGVAVLAALLLVVGAIVLAKRRPSVSVCIAFMFVPGAFAQTSEIGAHHPEQLIVRFKSHIEQSARDAVHLALAADPVRTYRNFDDVVVVKVAENQLEDALRDYTARPEIARVERDYLRFFASAPECPSDDYSATELWGMDRIRGPEAWCLWTGDPDVRVAVIDGGMYFDDFGVAHADLGDNIWTNPGEIPGNDIDDDGNGYVDDIHGYDFWRDDGYPRDPNNLLGWHGTHIAGTVGAVGNNGTGIVGVNWQTAIVPLKVAGSEDPDGPYTTPVSRVLAALDYIIENKIQVANLSVTAGSFSAEECDRIAQAGEQVGHIFVVAAGNTNKDLDVNPEYPAACEVPNILTVAATDKGDKLVYVTHEVCDCCHIVEAGPCDLRSCIGGGCVECNCDQQLLWASNFGAQSVHLSAPGIDIRSTIGDNGYQSKEGTSFAAPHVAGVVALMMSRYPDWSYQQIRQRILDRVQPAAHPSGKTMTDGIVDAYGAIWDCNDNGIDDECDLDCGAPGGSCDVTGCGQSFDCDANGIPDDCERDCNNNGLRDTCDLASGTSEDCDGNGIPDECDDCNGNGIIDACDVDCAALGGSCNVPGCGASNNCNGNCVPDECECGAIVLEPLIAEPGGVGKNRYFSFVPGNPGCRTAIRVYIELLPNGYGFEAFEGMVMWVDHPADVCESSGGVNPPCAPPGTFKGARLTCDPVYQDWSSIGLMHVYDDEIVPSAGDDLFSTQAVYTIRAIHDGCGTSSAPYVIIMSQWGDLTGGWDGASWTGPDGVVDLDDIDAVVAKFQDWSDAVSKTRADLAWDVPDRVVNFTDIGRVVDAYNGLLYPYDGPESCP